MDEAPEDLRRLLSAAERAAAAAGEVILQAPTIPSAESKGAGDYVTDVDRAAEAAVRACLADETPDLPVLGEEGGGERAGRRWIVDPLDGTTNFLHRFPLVGVSVALVDGETPIVGVVHAPYLGDTYAGARGLGAELRSPDHPPTQLRVSDRPPDRAVVGTGFPFRRKETLATYLPVMERALARFEDLRRPGAAALDLAWVAAGVFDGFFELGLAPWDVAAGALLIQEAGGTVTDWQGGTNYLDGNILAGNPAVHAELLRLAATP